MSSIPPPPLSLPPTLPFSQAPRNAHDDEATFCNFFKILREPLPLGLDKIVKNVQREKKNIHDSNDFPELCKTLRELNKILKKRCIFHDSTKILNTACIINFPAAQVTLDQRFKSAEIDFG